MLCHTICDQSRVCLLSPPPPVTLAPPVQIHSLKNSAGKEDEREEESDLICRVTSSRKMMNFGRDVNARFLFLKNERQVFKFGNPRFLFDVG